MASLNDIQDAAVARTGRIGRYFELGVSAVAISMSGRSRNQGRDNAAHIGSEVIARL
jgi:hypothetical protein